MITGGNCDKCGKYLDWVADNEFALCFDCEKIWKKEYKAKIQKQEEKKEIV
jgi:hypothetical protein